MDTQETYKTITVLVLVSLLVYAVNHNALFLLLAIILLINNVFFFWVNKLITKYWLKFAEVLGNVNTKILLTIIFFLFLTPLAFFYRIFNKHTTEYFRKDIQESYFAEVNESYNKNYFTKQW
ncbi:MAG: hypothetical protein AAB553_00350 [Patescibacteria group bacterium]